MSCASSRGKTRRVFASYPSLWAKEPLGADDPPPDSRNDGQEWHVSKPYTGEPFDPEEDHWRDLDEE